jgi:hypothetical protein
LRSVPRYMLIFHDDACNTEAMSPDDRKVLFDQFVAWADDLASRGLYEASEALTGNRQAKTVRRRGETVTIDGPFAESQEAVNGFFTIRADTMEAATTIASECPSLRLGWAVEVRELVEVVKPR